MLIIKRNKIVLQGRIKKITVNQFLNKGKVYLLFLLLFGACAGSKKVNYKNPKSVTLAFYKALANNDYERAKQLGTSETIKVLSMLQNLHDLLPEEEQRAAKEEGALQLKYLKKATCLLGEKGSEETATCQVCCDENGVSSTAPLTLRKENRRWLIHITKETLE